MRRSILQFHNEKEQCGDNFISTMHVVSTSEHVYNARLKLSLSRIDYHFRTVETNC